MKCDVYIRKKNYHRDQYIYIDFCVTCSQYNIPKKKRYMKSGTGDLAKEPFKRDLYIRPKALQMHKRGPHIRKRDLCGFRLRVGQETRPKRLTTAKGLYKRDLHVLKRDLHIRKRDLQIRKRDLCCSRCRATDETKETCIHEKRPPICIKNGDVTCSQKRR